MLPLPRPARSRFLALGLALAAAVALATLARLPAMSAGDQSGAMAVDCDGATAGVQTTCSYDAGGIFSAQVHVTKPPASGYTAFQSKLRWPAGTVSYQPSQDPGDEARWPRCTIAARSVQVPSGPPNDPAGFESVLSGCTPLPAVKQGDDATGVVFEYQFQCKESTGIHLALIARPGDPQLGSHFLDLSQSIVDPRLAGATVSCGPAPTATPCAPEGCPTATPTPTATPGPGGVVLDCDAATAGIQTTCSYPEGATFAVEVNLSEPPGKGFTAFQAKLRWPDGQLTYRPAPDPASEARWEHCTIAARTINEPPFESTGSRSVVYGCVPFPALQQPKLAAGALLRFEFQCGRGPEAALLLVPRQGDPQLGTHFIDVSENVVDPTLVGASILCQGAPTGTATPCAPQGCPAATSTPSRTPTVTSTSTSPPTSTRTATSTRTPCAPEGCPTATATRTATSTHTPCPLCTPTPTATPVMPRNLPLDPDEDADQDAEGQQGDVNQEGPEATATPTPDLPDLVVTFKVVELETGNSCVGPPPYILGVSVGVRNTGVADAGLFAVDVNGLQQFVDAGLRAGESLRLWFPGYSREANVAMVDATFLVTEANETNNTYVQQPVAVPTLPLTCTPTRTPTGTPTETATPTKTPTASASVTPTPAICPDVNRDGRVTRIDVLLMRIGLLFQRFGIVLERYDVDRDGDVDEADVDIVRAHLGERCHRR